MYLKCKPDKLGNPVVPGMKVSLMQHQLIGVKWMVERENKPEMGKKVKIDEGNEVTYGKAKTVNTVGGGLLADEMGLGKTIQSIALMVHNRPTDDEPVKVFHPLIQLIQDYVDRCTIGIDSPMEKRD
jgi:SNF2 family DNA or RNA helicase